MRFYAKNIKWSITCDPLHDARPTDPCPLPTVIKISYAISSSWSKSKFVFHYNPTFYFLQLWFTILAGDMASLMDKAKQFVSDAVASMEKPQASVTDVDLKGVSFGCVTYLAKVNVSNPYSVPIPIGEIRYILKSSGSEIATGTVPDPGSLKENGETMLNVEINVPHSVLVSLVKDIAVDWDIDYDLKVILVVDLPLIGEISIPVTSTGEVKLPSLADFFK